MYKFIPFWQFIHHSLCHLVLQALLAINPAVNVAFFKQVCDVSTESDEKEARTYQPPAVARTVGSCKDGRRVSSFQCHICRVTNPIDITVKAETCNLILFLGLFLKTEYYLLVWLSISLSACTIRTCSFMTFHMKDFFFRGSTVLEGPWPPHI
jgi:hypothetical protein